MYRLAALFSLDSFGGGFVVQSILVLWLSEFGRHMTSTEVVTHLEFIIFGSLICFLLIKEPHGFARLWALAKEKLRLWPFPY